MGEMEGFCDKTNYFAVRRFYRFSEASLFPRWERDIPRVGT